MQENVRSLRGPFGGIRSAATRRSISPLDCQDCLNVHTRFGDIRQRPGSARIKGTAGTVQVIPRVMRSFLVNNNSILLAWYSDNGERTSAPQNVSKFVGMDVSSLGAAHFFSIDAGTTTIRPGMVQAYNRIYCPQGDPSVSSKFYWDTTANAGLGGYVRARLGIAAPTVASSVTDNGAGSLPDGTYTYRYTFYNSQAGVESGPSPAGSGALAGGGSTARATYNASTDTQVDKIRIYRRLDGTDNTFYFVTEVANAAGALLDTDNAISKTFDDELNQVDGVPPTTTVACWHKRRMWWADGSDMVYSEVDRPEQVNAVNSYSFGGDTGDTIIGAISAAGYMFVMKSRSIWALAGDTPASFTVTKLTNDFGCVSPDTILDIEGVVYFVSQYGLCKIDNGLQFVGGDIEERFKEYNAGYRGWMHSAFEPVSRCYVLTGRRTGQSQFDRQIAYDVDRGNWFVWDMPASCIATHSAVANGPPSMYYGTDSANSSYVGDIAQVGGADGDYINGPMSWFWKTGELDFGTLRRKWIHDASIAWQGGGLNDTLTISRQLNGGASANLAVLASTSGLAPQLRRMHIGGRCDRLTLKIDGVSSTNINIPAIDFDAEAVGRR